MRYRELLSASYGFSANALAVARLAGVLPGEQGIHSPLVRKNVAGNILDLQSECAQGTRPSSSKFSGSWIT
jgi:hypothetical protein